METIDTGNSMCAAVTQQGWHTNTHNVDLLEVKLSIPQRLLPILGIYLCVPPTSLFLSFYYSHSHTLPATHPFLLPPSLWLKETLLLFKGKSNKQTLLDNLPSQVVLVVKNPPANAGDTNQV